MFEGLALQQGQSDILSERHLCTKNSIKVNNRSIKTLKSCSLWTHDMDQSLINNKAKCEIWQRALMISCQENETESSEEESEEGVNTNRARCETYMYM